MSPQSPTRTLVYVALLVVSTGCAPLPPTLTFDLQTSVRGDGRTVTLVGDEVIMGSDDGGFWYTITAFNARDGRKLWTMSPRDAFFARERPPTRSNARGGYATVATADQTAIISIYNDGILCATSRDGTYLWGTRVGGQALFMVTTPDALYCDTGAMVVVLCPTSGAVARIIPGHLRPAGPNEAVIWAGPTTRDSQQVGPVPQVLMRIRGCVGAWTYDHEVAAEGGQVRWRVRFRDRDYDPASLLEPEHPSSQPTGHGAEVVITRSVGGAMQTIRLEGVDRHKHATVDNLFVPQLYAAGDRVLVLYRNDVLNCYEPGGGLLWRRDLALDHSAVVDIAIVGNEVLAITERLQLLALSLVDGRTVRETPLPGVDREYFTTFLPGAVAVVGEGKVAILRLR